MIYEVELRVRQEKVASYMVSADDLNGVHHSVATVVEALKNEHGHVQVLILEANQN